MYRIVGERIKIHRLSFIVAVPIPSRDRKGLRIAKRRIEGAAEEVMKAFGEWFGGATAMAWPRMGTWIRTDGEGILIDKEQLVVVVLTTRTLYGKKRNEIAKLVEKVESPVKSASLRATQW